MSQDRRLDHSAAQVHQVRMRTEQAPPVRLQDYRPPDWLVETVDLDVSLDPKATPVHTPLTLKPNPKAAAPGPPILHGDGPDLRSLNLAGAGLAGRAQCAGDAHPHS